MTRSFGLMFGWAGIAPLASTMWVLAACAAVPVPPPVLPDAGQSMEARAASVIPQLARKRLRVLGTNDFHGNLLSTRPAFAAGRAVGGAATLAAYFAHSAAEIDAPTILVDAGDVMQGTPVSNLTMGRSTVDFYNAVGYTAAAIGNHEFDWGVEVLRERIEQAEFGWLSANLFVKGTDTLPSWAEPTRTVRLPGCAAGPPACDSVQVGIIGLSTTETPTAAMPSHVAPFDFGDEAAAIDRWVPVLREKGADFVIVTAHEGAYCAEAPATRCAGPIMAIASRLRHPPDLIISGHSHTRLDVRAAGVPIVQGGSQGARYSVVDLERFSEDSVSVRVRAQPIAWVDEIAADTSVTRLVGSYESSIGPLLYEVVTHLQEPLVRHGPQHALGNLIADTQRAATNAQVAIMNNGGIRTDLPAGPVRYDDLYRVQPFANTLVTMELTGDQLLRALENALSRGSPSAHVSGVRVRYSPTAPLGSRVLEGVMENGSMLDPNARYRVVVNNFMAEGGDGFTVLLEGAEIHHTGIADLDALIAYLRLLPSPVVARSADRFTAVE